MERSTLASLKITTSWEGPQFLTPWHIVLLFHVEIFNSLAIEPEQQFLFVSPPSCKISTSGGQKTPNVVATVRLFFELGIDSCSSHIHSNENMPRFDPSAQLGARTAL